jgi:hypothetical protein
VSWGCAGRHQGPGGVRDAHVPASFQKAASDSSLEWGSGGGGGVGGGAANGKAHAIGFDWFFQCSNSNIDAEISAFPYVPGGRAETVNCRFTADLPLP